MKFYKKDDIPITKTKGLKGLTKSLPNTIQLETPNGTANSELIIIRLLYITRHPSKLWPPNKVAKESFNNDQSIGVRIKEGYSHGHTAISVYHHRYESSAKAKKYFENLASQYEYQSENLALPYVTGDLVILMDKSGESWVEIDKAFFAPATHFTIDL